MEEALRQKEAGNASFKAGKLDDALSCYQQAVRAILDDPAAAEVRRNLYGNMSMVMLKIGFTCVSRISYNYSIQTL